MLGPVGRVVLFPAPICGEVLSRCKKITWPEKCAERHSFQYPLEGYSFQYPLEGYSFQYPLEGYKEP